MRSIATRAAVALALLGATCATAAGPAEWRFAALLDGTQIGTHRFELRSGASDTNLRELRSVALFEVKVLGLVVYRYRHRAEEQWRGDCLASMTAHTDDDGRVTEVSGRAIPAAFVLDVRAAESGSPVQPPEATRGDCLMSFAYWNPRLARQSRLLDPGTGRVETVTITDAPATTLQLRGKQVTARGVRISGLTHPIDVWYVGDEWVGLDTTVGSGRRLSYRPL